MRGRNVTEELEDELLRRVTQDPFKGFDQFPEYQEYFIQFLRPEKFAKLCPLGPSGKFADWMERRIEVGYERHIRTPFSPDNGMMEHYLTVVHDRSDAVRALEFALRFSKTHTSSYTGDLTKTICAMVKRNDVYWDVPSLSILFDRLTEDFEHPCTTHANGHPKVYNEAAWINLQRFVNFAIEERDASLLLKLQTLKKLLEEKRVRPHDSFGLFGREDHLHFLESRTSFLAGEQSAQENDSLKVFAEKIKARARLQSLPKVDLRFKQCRLDGVDLVLTVEASSAAEQNKVDGALKNFRIHTELQGIRQQAEIPTEFSLNTWTAYLGRPARVGRIWTTIKYGREEVAPRRAFYLR